MERESARRTGADRKSSRSAADQRAAVDLGSVDLEVLELRGVDLESRDAEPGTIGSDGVEGERGSGGKMRRETSRHSAGSPSRSTQRSTSRAATTPSPLIAPRPTSVPALSTGPIGIGDAAPVSAGRWLPVYLLALAFADACAMAIGAVFGRMMNDSPIGVRGVPYLHVLAVTVPAWLAVLAASRAYDGRCIGLGSEEFRRIVNAAVRFTAALAVVVFLFRLDVARGLVVLSLPAACLFAVVFRYLARRVLHRVRAEGGASHRVLVVGEGSARDVLAARLHSAPYSGLHVVGVCRPVTLTGPAGQTSVAHVAQTVRALGADTVAVAHSPGVTPDVLRRIAWTLEGTGVDLLVAPAFTDVAGPRIHVRPVSGLPLLQIAEPEFSGFRRLAKGTIDLLGATALIALLSPVLIAAAVAVRLSGPGPILFCQTRIGRDGRPFAMYKFRSMVADAEARLAELRALNDHAGSVLFKIRHDPRVTRVGRVLRRCSIDELPQLLNVVRGQMSLVGPRPPLPDEVARYESDTHRRLLVKPGLTGLWQVSGRSDLDWDETVRLDLYYVENWSVALDVEILAKTFSAVLRGSGAC
jgi:exopolysaccharide biosynthesis polyprenyl glycosylphosphotransferase